ncbi:MAG: DUF4918 family protein [Bacteroidetes bacterium]|nr:DUF4918 family protein [Bacteroidota bacterium]
MQKKINKILSSTTFAYRTLDFFLNLSTPDNLPKNITTMNPYETEEVKNIVIEFFKKYFNDNNKRILALGINPGRFGGGITGVSFTDPIALEKFCGIKNGFDKKREISSEFIYSFITKYGGVEEFYSKCFISALYPLALIKDGLNYNYYDEQKLFRILKPAIVDSIKAQIDFGIKRDFVICLGRKNSLYLKEINDEHNFFDKIIVLDHPRYIMQYKRKSMHKYLDEYIKAFNDS